MRDHPPRFAIERKRAVMAGITVPIVGTLRVSRWRGSLPDRIGASSSPVLELAEHHFAYAPDEPGTVRWHLNFAAPHELMLVMDPAGYLATIGQQLDAFGRGEPFDLVLYNAGMDPYEGYPIGGMPGIDDVMLAARERLVFGWARGHGWPLAFVIAGGYLGDGVDQRRLVDLHRATLLEARG